MTTRWSDKLDIAMFRREFAKRGPDAKCTWTAPQISVTIGLRKQVRAAFDMARVLGAEVEVHEQKGWFESNFAARVGGTERQLMPLLTLLASLED